MAAATGKGPVFFLLAAILVLQTRAQQGRPASIADANNKFSFDLLGQLTSGGVQNTFYSPFSICNALGMVYLGAAGNTKKQMETTLNYNALTLGGNQPDNVHRANKQLLDLYNRGTRNYTLSVANRLYPAKKFEILPEYKNKAREYYGAEPEQLDFANRPEDSASKINRWVEGKTNNKIKNLFDPSAFNADTMLVLVSAIYFKGNWEKAFTPSETKEEDFTLADGSTTRVQMMTQTNDFRFAYDEGLQVKVIELPYVGGDLSMYVFLPDEVNGIKSLVGNLNNDKFNKIRSEMRSERVQLKLPKFKLETKYNNMAEILGRMGMPDLFSNSAKLTGISGSKKLKVEKVAHQSAVEVTEEGTTASGATSVNMINRSMGPEEFWTDHPFLVLLCSRHNTNSSVILFQGVVMTISK